MSRLHAKIRRYYSTHVTECRFVDDRIRNLSDFLSVLSGLVTSNREYWYRGHSSAKHKLIPSALRYETVEERNTALSLVHEFKRLVAMRIESAVGPDADLKWIQIAQHYGLPTRLLDWTENAAAALYFACSSRNDEHGMVYVMNPGNLNRLKFRKIGRPLNGHVDFGRYCQMLCSEKFFKRRIPAGFRLGRNVLRRRV